MCMIKNIVGVILAGGESRRFGSPKAFALRDHLPFYQYSLQAIEPFVPSTLIVTSPKLEGFFMNENIKTSIVKDDETYHGQGPLAGIYTAMDTVVTDWYMVIPIDVPFVEQWVFKRLIKYIDGGRVDAIVPTVHGKKQPLLSIYHYDMKNWIKKQLDMGKRSVHELLNERKVVYVSIEEEKPFTNINWKEDYQQLIQKRDFI